MQQCYTFSLPCYIENSLIFNDMLFVHALSIDLTYLSSLHEITAGHRPLSGAISHYVRIPFLPVTMTGRFSNFNSVSYTEDWHKLRVTGSKCGLPDMLSGTGEIFISGAEVPKMSIWTIYVSSMCLAILENRKMLSTVYDLSMVCIYLGFKGS